MDGYCGGGWGPTFECHDEIQRFFSKIFFRGKSERNLLTLISRLVDAGVLDPWQKVYPQGIYGLLRHQIKSNTHKGWLAERCSLQEAPRRLALVRKEGHAQAAIVCSYPQLWEVTRGEAG